MPNIYITDDEAELLERLLDRHIAASKRTLANIDDPRLSKEVNKCINLKARIASS